MEGVEVKFSIVDYCVFIVTLVISFVIGMGTAFKGNRSPEEFLMGNRSFRTIPVSMSLLTSFISGVNFIGFTSEIYAYGMQLSLIIVGVLLGIALAAMITLPVLYPLNLTSVNEYIELRFKSPKLRICMTALIFFLALIFVGICIYAPSLSLAAVTPIHYTTYIYVMGGVCTVYSSIGGIRAVIWTDVFQFFIMMTGLIVLVVVGTIKAGGIGKVFTVAMEGGRLDFFNMNPSIYERHNFYNTIAFGTFHYAAVYGIAQINVQRICAVSSMKEAKKVYGFTAVGNAVIYLIIFLGGLITYATYAGCDPISEGRIQKKDEILSYFIMDKLGDISGIPGLFVATLIATTLSTFSSVANAQVALIWKDCFSKLKIFSSAKPATAALINKVLTLFVGAAFTGMAILTSKAKSIIQLMLSVSGIVFGSMYGVFILGMCFPKCNWKGAWSGFLISNLFLIWIYVGSVVYSNAPEHLPLSTELCEEIHFGNLTTYETNFSSAASIYSVIVSNGTKSPVNSETSTAKNSSLMYLYGISYTLYSVIGPLLCIAVGILVSYITGPQKPEDVPLELIAPFLRKFYKKENSREHFELREKDYNFNPVSRWTEVEKAKTSQDKDHSESQ